MAFKALRGNKLVYSTMYSFEEWLELQQVKGDSGFKMQCCGARAVLKVSPLQTQFFSHYGNTQKDSCTEQKGETEEHLDIKFKVAKAMQECGWLVEVEKQGQS